MQVKQYKNNFIIIHVPVLVIYHNKYSRINYIIKENTTNF